MVKRKKSNKKVKPFVSICTPTFNRRPFIYSMIKCFLHQDYPKEKMEWIIIDDGTDKIEDLVKDIPQVKYFKYDTKMSLGKKRNLMHEKSKGDILVYMDDDDYYPPQRVSHAVSMLQTHPKAICSGSSEIYIWFQHIKKMFQFGPYNSKHATAGTFAFKRELLKEHSYDNDAALAEEKAFLKNYSVPFVQLEPKKAILVFSHAHNTFDKRKLLENPHPQFVRESDKTVDDFIKEPELKDFYMNKIEGLLETYEPGRPNMKPDVLQQIIEIEERRRKEIEQMTRQNGQVIIEQHDGTKVALNNDQIVQILKQQQDQLKRSFTELNTLKQQCTGLAEHSQKLTTQLEDKDEIINKLRELNKILMKKFKDEITNSIFKEEVKKDVEKDIENITLGITEMEQKESVPDDLFDEINQKIEIVKLLLC